MIKSKTVHSDKNLVIHRHIKCPDFGGTVPISAQMFRCPACRDNVPIEDILSCKPVNLPRKSLFIVYKNCNQTGNQKGKDSCMFGNIIPGFSLCTLIQSLPGVNVIGFLPAGQSPIPEGVIALAPSFA